jgi:hypothetical protein
MAGRKLKVFQAQFGFYDTVVAASSRAAALRAWGTRQDLFASGEAKETTDASAVSAATCHPETVLKRPVGSKAAFEIDPDGLPDVPKAPAKLKAVKAAQAARKPVTKSPPSDRSALDAAETELQGIDTARKAEEAHLRKRQAALEAEFAAAQTAYVAARKAATAKVVEARTAYRKAGGRD